MKNSFHPGMPINLIVPSLGSTRASRMKILLDVFFALVSCPIRWRPLPERILHIQPCAALHEQADDLVVTTCGCLMQRRRMSMDSNGIVSIRIFTSIEQQRDDLCLTILRRQSQGTMALLTGGCQQQPLDLFGAPQSSGKDHIERGTIASQGVDRLQFLMEQRGDDRTRWLSAVSAEEINQGNLHATLARHAPRADQSQRLI